MTTSSLPMLDIARTALLFDVDGVLAPIVEDPADAAVPAETLELLARAKEQCALVGVVSGRSAQQLRELVPIEGIWRAASHGMHMLAPDGDEQVDPVAVAARPHLDTMVTLARTVGWRFEDKGQSVTVHFRHVATPDLTARQMRAQMSTVLDPRAVQVHDARMALEVRPTGARTKGDAVAMLLDAAPQGTAAALYVGDDRTDLDAFGALGQREGIRAVRVAVDSAEAPPELLASADVVLASQGDVPELLEQLLG